LGKKKKGKSSPGGSIAKKVDKGRSNCEKDNKESKNDTSRVLENRKAGHQAAGQREGAAALGDS